VPPCTATSPTTPLPSQQFIGRDCSHSGCNAGLRRGEERRVHFIHVAKWLGHSSYVLTLTTYADYIPE
jgi:hypothetical protein